MTDTKTSTRTSVIRTPEDQRIIDSLKQRFGLSADIDVVRLSLRIVEESDIKLEQTQHTENASRH